MWFNYLKITFRSLLKNGFYSFINIAGLAVGLASCLLILLYVQHQLSYNDYNEKGSRIYRVVEDQHYSNGHSISVDATPGPLAPALKAEIPQIENATRVSWDMKQNLFANGRAYQGRGTYVDPAFLEMFTVELLSGSAKALEDVSSIAISERLALTIFNTTEVVGKSLSVENKDEVRVTAVFKNVPNNSSLQYDFLLPYPLLLKDNAWLESWGSNGIRTFVLLHEEADVAQAKAAVKNVVMDRKAQDNTLLYLQPLKDMHLYSQFRGGENVSGKIILVRLFAGIALFLLLIACINFMNLSTARSIRRSREVGVRKALGAYREQLVVQFLSESTLICLLAGLFALLLAQAAMPLFNSITGFQLSIPFTDGSFLLLFLGLILFTGFIAGSYPALMLSSFNTIEVLKGKGSQGKGGVLFRKGLVVFQFFISIVLIVGTLVVSQQIDFMKNKDLGLSVDNVLMFPVNNELKDHFPAFQAELGKQTEVEAVTATSQNPLQIGNNSADVDWPGKSEEDKILFQKLFTDAEFVETFQVKLLEGRNFHAHTLADTASFILNETAVRLMGLDNAVGTPITAFGVKGTITGVVRDFHTSSARNSMDPVIITLDPGSRYHAFVKLTGLPSAELLRTVKSVYKTYSPSFPFEHTLLKDNYQNMYSTDALIGRLTAYFSVFAIAISCLGLFGLAAFTTEQRRKEIGVRKVLGASVTEIMILLSGSFAKWVGLAFVFAAPLSWWLMSLYLSNYAHRISLGVSPILLAGLLALVLAMLTVSFLSIKAARTNPAFTLKEE